ncbi:MAG TPA: hypothetical protein DCS93_07395 [Microscillaceae bacterium]|nr:hypothetical protein [Microscillaceae bacterium]
MFIKEIKKLGLLLCCIVGLVMSGAAQTNCDKINELNTKLLVLSNDTTKVNVLNELAYEYLIIDKDMTYKYANSAYALAKRLDYRIGEGKALIYLGKQHYRKALEFDSTLSHYQEALSLFESENSLKHVAEAHEAIGEHFHDLFYLNKEAHYAEALKSYQQAVTAFEQWKPRGQMSEMEKEYLANLFQKLAELYTVTEQDDEALKYSRKSIRLKQRLEKYQNNFDFQFINGRVKRLNRTLRKERYTRYGLFGTIGLLVLFAILLSINNGQKLKVNKKLKQQTRDLEKKNQQINQQNTEINRQNKDIELANFELTEITKTEKAQKEAIQTANQELREKNEEILAQRKQILESNEELNKKNEEIHFQYQQLEKSNEKFLKANQLLNTMLDEIEQKNEQIKASVTDLEQQRDDLSSAKTELEKLQRSKARLTAMVAHDLRNPLNVVVGYSNPDSSIRIDGDTKKHIYKASQRINSLIDDMLDVQKYAESDLPIDKKQDQLFQTAQNAINELSIFAEQKGLNLQNNISPQWESLYDGKYIRRVFENLLTNAIKFTPNGGKILFEAKENPQNDNLVVSVTDTGEGIPTDKFKEIFEPFNQLDARNFANTSSTGLGLAFCKMAIEAHQSQIQVASTLGVGTRFFFELPKILVAEHLTSDSSTGAPDQPSALVFSEEDKQFLASYVAALKKYELYEISDLEKVLAQIEVTDRPHLETWKNRLKSAIDNYNETEYHRLIELATIN